MKIVDVNQPCYITCYAHESNATDRLNVLDIQDVAHGTLTKNITRQRPVLTSLSAFQVWDILRHAAHACAPAILDAGIAH